MTGRELFMLIGGGVLALYGALVWRIAWTGELPSSVLRGGGWRRRLRNSLAMAPPTGRLMPALIVNLWLLYLMAVFLIVSDHLDGAAARATRTAGLALLVAFVAVTLLIVCVSLFNRPRAIIPPYARGRR